VREFADLVVAMLGPIDVRINNAGAMGPVIEVSALPAAEAATVAARTSSSSLRESGVSGTGARSVAAACS
jgi:NAD(P)-dependent dehydrogenase (short-subunit alcohol dehydrogenase family)